MKIKDLHRWLMLGVLVFAPWAFGSTRDWTITALNVLLGVVIVLWFAGAAVERALPKVPVTLAILSLLLSGYAWWMAANAKFNFDINTWTFYDRATLVASAPGSIDHNDSQPWAWRVPALLAAVCCFSDMSRSSRWRTRLTWTMAITGASLALLGLAQRMLGAPTILWQAQETGKTFFATYTYHSNAGTFLNLIWPLAAALCVTCWRRGQNWIKPTLWGAVVLLCLSGLVVSGARAATAIAGFLLVLWGAWIIWQFRRGQLPPLSRPAVMVGAALLVLLMVSVAAMAGLDVSARRWAKIEELFSHNNPRLLVDYTCLKMIPDAGWFGFGPGTFRIAFPYYTHELKDAVSGIWRYAHQDYLQTFIEWGRVGALLWAVWLMGGLVSSARALRSAADQFTFRDRALHFGIVTAVAGALLHAMVDFPFQIASIQLYFGALLALLWSQPSWRKESACPP